MVTFLLLNACQEGKPVNIFYGEKFESANSVTPEQLITLVEALDEESVVSDVVVSGVIEKSCTHSGCWLTLENEQGAKILVTYKDEAFTTEKRIKGKKVTLKGDASKDGEQSYKVVASGLILN